MRKENLNYLAKLEEDPYSNAILEEASDMLATAGMKLDALAFSELSANQVYYLLGYQKALSEIMLIPQHARQELSALDEA